MIGAHVVPSAIFPLEEPSTMRFFVLTTMLVLGAIIGLSPVKAFPPLRPPPPRQGTKVDIAITFTFNSEVGKVRMLTPPDNFDEKGNVKKYTKAELRKLKGDTPAEKKLAGYKAEFSDVKVDDVVEVSISLLKGGTTKPTKKDKASKKEDTDTDKPAKESKPAKTGKWVVTNKLLGKVTKIPAAKTTTDGDPKMTIQVTTVVPAGAALPKTTQTFDEEKYAATLIVIGRRAPQKR
jgi:hypothetical protein